MCSINNASASAQQHKVKPKPQGEAADIPYLCTPACTETRRPEDGPRGQECCTADKHANTSGSLPALALALTSPGFPLKNKPDCIPGGY